MNITQVIAKRSDQTFTRRKLRNNPTPEYCLEILKDEEAYTLNHELAFERLINHYRSMVTPEVLSKNDLQARHILEKFVDLFSIINKSYFEANLRNTFRSNYANFIERRFNECLYIQAFKKENFSALSGNITLYETSLSSQFQSPSKEGAIAARSIVRKIEKYKIDILLFLLRIKDAKINIYPGHGGPVGKIDYLPQPSVICKMTPQNISRAEFLKEFIGTDRFSFDEPLLRLVWSHELNAIH